MNRQSAITVAEGGGLQLKRVKNEASDVIEQSLVSPDDVPSTVNEHMMHVRML